MKAIFKGPGQNLAVKVDRYELSLRIIIVPIPRHISPFLTKRSLAKTLSSIWRYYHAFKTFSTASTLRLTGSRIYCRDPVEPLVMSRFISVLETRVLCRCPARPSTSYSWDLWLHEQVKPGKALIQSLSGAQPSHMRGSPAFPDLFLCLD